MSPHMFPMRDQGRFYPWGTFIYFCFAFRLRFLFGSGRGSGSGEIGYQAQTIGINYDIRLLPQI